MRFREILIALVRSSLRGSRERGILDICNLFFIVMHLWGFFVTAGHLFQNKTQPGKRRKTRQHHARQLNGRAFLFPHRAAGGSARRPRNVPRCPAARFGAKNSGIAIRIRKFRGTLAGPLFPFRHPHLRAFRVFSFSALGVGW